MKQMWLVFWKDVRHLWPELGVYALLLSTLALMAPQMRPGQELNQTFALLDSLPKILIAASWLVIIARVVHTDNLLGETQFWVTRPYRWQALLGAKALFIGVCVVMPFVLMQWWVLLASGLDPFADPGGMGLTLMRLTLQVWLPLFVAASITETLAMMFTFVAGALVVWVCFMALVLSGTDSQMSAPYSLSVCSTLFGGSLVAILLYQYARRKTTHSRWALAGLLLLFLLTLYGYGRGGFGVPVKALIRNHFSESLTVKLAATDTVPHEERTEDMQVSRHSVEVKLPVRMEGLPPDLKLRETNVAVVLESGGMRYAPPWQTATVSEHAIGFVMPKDVYERFADVDARIHLEVVAEEWRPASVQSAAVSETKFAGPMKGMCAFLQDKVYCRYPYRERVPTHVIGRACGVDEAGTLRHVPAQMAIDPVVNEVLPFKGKVCAGDWLVFTEYAQVGRFRTRMDVPSVRIRGFRVW